MQAKVFIIIVNWNSWQDTVECLESVFRLNYGNYSVVVCDNHSHDGSVTKIQAWAEGRLSLPPKADNPLSSLIYPPIEKPITHQCLENQSSSVTSAHSVPLTLIDTGANLGFAGGNNRGIEYAMNHGADYIWLLNNDTVVARDCLSQMVQHSTEYGVANTCGSTLMHYYQPEVVQALGGNRYNKWTGLASTSLGRGLSIHEPIDHAYYEKQLSYISGASWLIPKDFIQQIGLMEESYFLYCEEIDWCVRNNHRYELTYAPNALVYHKEGGSIGSPNLDKPSSLFSDFYIFRNKLRFTKRFFPEAIISNYITSCLQLLNRARKGQWDKVWLIGHLLLGREEKAAQLAFKN